MPLNPDAPSFVPFDKPPVAATASAFSQTNNQSSSVNQNQKAKNKNKRKKQRKGKCVNVKDGPLPSSAKNENKSSAEAKTNDGNRSEGRQQAKKCNRGGKNRGNGKPRNGTVKRQHKGHQQKHQIEGLNLQSTEETRDQEGTAPAHTALGSDQPFVAEQNTFPALLWEQTELEPLDSLDNQDDTGRAWAKVASHVVPTAHTDQSEPFPLVETSSGLRLTLLGKDKPHSNPLAATGTKALSTGAASSPANDTISEQSVEQDNEEPTICVAETEKEQQPTVTVPTEYSPRKLQPPRINMTKLRDKWWDALRKQRRRLQMQKEQEAEQPQERQLHQSTRDHESSSSEDTEEEYVDTNPLFFSSGEDARVAEQTPEEADLIKRYLQYSHPVHCAIFNHDVRALEALFGLPANDKALRQSEVNETKQLNGDITRQSSLQLAVKMDKPDLLRLLIDVEQKASRRKKDNESSLLYDSLKSVQRYPTPLMMAVKLGHEECVEALLAQPVSYASVLVATKDKKGNNALHYCCGSTKEETGRAGTPSILRALLRIIIDAGGTAPSKTLSAKNILGQTALHVACERGRVELVEVFLDVCGSGSSFSVFVKLLSVQDQQGQTPLLSAVASGSTDLVMTLLSWRGNHYHHQMGTRQRQKASNMSIATSSHSSKLSESSTCCPLAWAIKTSANVDVVVLLLEFQAPSMFGKSDDEGQGYDMALSLQEAVIKSASRQATARPGEHQSDEELLEIIEVLIENGANPAEERDLDQRLAKRKDLSKTAGIGEESETPTGAEVSKAATPTKIDNAGSFSMRTSGASAITLAAALGDAPTLVALLGSLISQRKRVKESRRRDPALRKQPESFFRGLESIEESEMRAALSDALVTSLFCGYNVQSARNTPLDRTSAGAFHESCGQNAEEHLSCSHVLFHKGAQLGSTGLARLRCSLGGSPILLRSDEVILNTAESHCYDFRTGYRRDVITVPTGSVDVKLTMKDRSELLCRMPWMKRQMRQYDTVHCEWMKEQCDSIIAIDHGKESDFLKGMQSDLVVLVTDNGEGRVLAHGSITSQQSAKLEAAVRFAKMSQDGPNTASSEQQRLEINLGSTPTRLCLLMLQHLYHGAIICGLSADPLQCSQELLDLLLLSEEFLCPSLMQECEMKLLNNNPWQCFCWSCNRSNTMETTTVPTGYDNKYDECVYIVRGPPLLLTPATVIDVVAVAQHLEDAQFSLPEGDACVLNFAIRGGEVKLEPKTPSDKALPSTWTHLSTRPLAGLREVSLSIILSNYVETLQSEAYKSQLEEGGSPTCDASDMFEDPKKGASIMLLRMCLEEFAVSDFKEAWSVHALAKKVSLGCFQ